MSTNTDIKKFNLNIKEKNSIKNELQQRWKLIENIPEVFAYKLKIRKEKCLLGYYKFYCQVCNCIYKNVNKI